MPAEITAISVGTDDRVMEYQLLNKRHAVKSFTDSGLW